jgi:hypothetical protein
MFRFQNWMFWFLLASFQWLIFEGMYKSFPFPPLEAAGSTNENTHSKAFVNSPLHLLVRFGWFVRNPSQGWVRSSLWALELCEAIFVHWLLLKVKPPRWLDISLEFLRLWWAVGKFVKVRFASARKEARASEVRKAVERDSTWSWLLVGNSSYLNGDIGITCGDSELRQTNHCVHPLVCVLMFLLYELLE